MTVFLLLIAALCSALACAALIVALLPLARLYALARPNARSSHKVPTPQGGGAPVIAATLGVTFLVAWLAAPQALPPLALAIAVLAIAITGAVDDIRPLPALLRLALQTGLVALVIFALPDARVMPSLPLALERGLAVLAGVWFVNLVNFMDGLDWMSVAEIVPVAAVLAGIGMMLGLPDVALLGAALAGAMAGFAPFNRPVAKLFLGDVGSLPIGLLVAFGLYRIAAEGFLAAAIILPLYYIADATITLGRRAWARERLWEAHRTHFYQRATDKGHSVMGVVSQVALINVALGALAIFTVLANDTTASRGAVGLGLLGVALVLLRFSSSPGRRA